MIGYAREMTCACDQHILNSQKIHFLQGQHLNHAWPVPPHALAPLYAFRFIYRTRNIEILASFVVLYIYFLGNGFTWLYAKCYRTINHDTVCPVSFWDGRNAVTIGLSSSKGLNITDIFELLMYFIK